MNRRAPFAALAGGCLILVASCAPRAATAPAPGPAAPDAPRLPPVPRVLGDLDIRVVYPPEGASIAVRDSTFIFGSTGRGDAALTINGIPVEVAPNGAWLAFLPVPPDGVYRLSATGGGQTAELVRNVSVPGPPAPPTGALRIVPGSVTPRGTITGTRGEPIEVSFRGTPGGTARLILPDSTIVPMVERQAVDRRAGFMLQSQTAATGVAEYVGSFELASPIVAPDADAEAPSLTLPQPAVAAGATVELAMGGQAVRAPVPATIAVLDPFRPRIGVAATSRPDSTVIGRRAPGADQAWDFFWPNGTLLTIDGEVPGFYRVRLTPELSAFVSADEVELLDPATPVPRGFVGPSIELDPSPGWVTVRFSMSERLPFRVDPSEWGLGIEFYNATGRPAYVGYGPQDPFVQRIDWEQRTDDLFRFNLHLRQPLWGYQYRWEGTALVLQVRRPPTIEPGSPLRGLKVAVDAGHKGSATDTGAQGPTGLREADATLAVARSIATMLRERGADVLEIRPDTGVVPLIDRPIAAAEEDAQLFISVHFNAFPDGVNPFENHGTTMFYFWPHSLELARRLQAEIVGELGLPDRGVRYQNLAITRTTWMPAVLTETAFMMFPEQEAALRDPRVIDRIAAAHVRAMEAFVRERATLVAEAAAAAR